jgi:hypothetical protein
MGAVIPHETSRYLLSDELELIDGTLIWTAPEPVGHLGLSDDIVHIVTEGDTLFSLAMKYYIRLLRPEQYYWAIADYQHPPIGDPLEPLEIGREIYIPSVRTLQEIILNEDRREVSPEMLVSGLER